MKKNTTKDTIYTLISLFIVSMMMANVFSGVSAEEERNKEVDYQNTLPTTMEVKNLTRDDVVVVKASQIPALVGTPVSDVDVKDSVNNILVYAWNNTTKQWRQIPFQVDERNATTLNYGIGVDGIFDGIDEIAFMARDTGDKAPLNAWVVGCDAPRYEIQVKDPFTGEAGWAYIYKSEEIEANFTGDYTSFDKSTNDISAEDYCIGFHDGTGMVMDFFNVTSQGGGDGTDLVDILQMEVSGTVLGQTQTYDEDDMTNDFNMKKDGYVRSIGSLSIHKYASQSGITVDAYLNYTWLFNPDYVKAEGYIDLHVSGSVTIDIWMALDNSPDACPMEYRDSLGNNGTANGDSNDDNIGNTNLQSWWELSGSHGGYVCLWDFSDLQASSKDLKFSDDSSADESSHVWADQKGHWGMTGSSFSSLTKVQKSWGNMSFYPVPANISDAAEGVLTNVSNPLEVNSTIQHSPTVWAKKTASPTAVDSGDSVQYTVYFNNTGDRTAGHVWINDSIPADMVYVDDNASSIEGVRTGDDYNWTFSNVAPGTHYFVINCTVSDSAIPGEVMRNEVYCDFNSSAGMMPRSHAHADVRVKSPVISVEKTVDKSTCVPGDVLQYRIYFNNTGETKADTVWINDTLPSYLDYLSDNSSQMGGTAIGTEYIFHNVSVGTHWFVINATVKDAPDNTNISNYVHLDYTAPGGYKLNSSEDWANSTIVKPILEISARSNVSAAKAGDKVAYIIYFNNTGSADASHLWLNVSLPSDLTYLDDTSSSEGGSKTGDYNWTFSNIAAGTNHHFQINVSVNGGVIDGTNERTDIEAEYSTSAGYIYSQSANASFTAEAPNIEVKKTVNRTAIRNDTTPDAELQYILYFNNTGSVNASSVWINDTLPSNVSYVSDSNATENGTYLGNYHWLFKNVTVGEHYFVINVTVNQKLSDGDKIVNNVTLEYKDTTNTSMPASDSSATTVVSSKPLIKDTTRGNPTTGDEYNITCNVTSPQGISGVHLYYWFETTAGNTLKQNVSMNSAGNDMYYYVVNTPSDGVVLHYNISAVDNNGKWSQTGMTDRNVDDNDKPQITDTSPDGTSTGKSPNAGHHYNVTATVSDNIGLNGVWLNYNLSSSDYSQTKNVSMNGTYWYNISVWSNATCLNYTIYAEDSSGNWNHSSRVLEASHEDIPTILDTTTGNPTTGEVFEISAEIKNEYGVSSANLYYWFETTIGNTAAQNVSMNDNGNGNYNYRVDVPSNAIVLHYNISAEDTYGNWNQTGDITRNVADNDKPQITDTTSGSPTTGDSFTFSAEVTDNIAVDSVYVEYWFDSGSHNNESMSNTGGNTWEHTIIVTSDATTLHYIFHASDTSNTWDSTPERTLTVIDNDKPQISDATSGSPTTGDSFTFSAEVTDNIAVDSVYVEYYFQLTDDTYTNHENSTMSISGSLYDCTVSVPDSAESLYYTISARDDAVNWANSGEKILDVSDNDAPEIRDTTMTPTTGDICDVVATISDNVGISSANLNYWFETTAGNTNAQNISMSGGNGNIYGASIDVPANARVLHYTLYAEDTSGNMGNLGGTVNVVDNDKPQPSISIGPGGYQVGDSMTLNASHSTDNIGISNYTWYINGSSSHVLYGVEVSYTFQSAGNYTITLIVRDSAGNVGTTTMPETVNAASSPATPSPQMSSGSGNDWWWLLPLILIILLLLILFAWKRRKKEPEDEHIEEEMEENGKAADSSYEASETPEEAENLEYEEDEEQS